MTVLTFDYDFKELDSLNELKKLIFEKNANKNARLLAGYCWNWINEGKNNTDVHNIVIDDFSMNWNLGNSDTWAIYDDSVNEIDASTLHMAWSLTK